MSFYRNSIIGVCCHPSVSPFVASSKVNLNHPGGGLLSNFGLMIMPVIQHGCYY